MLSSEMKERYVVMPNKIPNYYRQITSSLPVVDILNRAAEGNPQSILALSDGNMPGWRSAASIIVDSYTTNITDNARTSTSPAGPIEMAAQSTVDTASTPLNLLHLYKDDAAQIDRNDTAHSTPTPLIIVQSDIEPHWQGGCHLPQNKTEPRVEYIMDDNLHPSGIAKRSHDGKGFNLIIAISVLCLCSCDLSKTPDSQHTLCGGMDCTPEQILSFFLTKILPNLKNQQSVAIVSGSCFHTEKRRTELYSNKFKKCAFRWQLAKLVKPHIKPEHDSVQLVKGASIHNRARILAKQAVSRYQFGLQTTHKAIDLFNRHPHNCGFRASIQLLELDGNPNIGSPGYVVTIQQPSRN